MSQQLEIFVTYDRIGGFFEQPFFAPNKGCVTRAFQDLAAQTKGITSLPMLLHPDHYEIYHLGSYDSNGGTISPLKKPDYWCKISDILSVVEDQPGAAVGVQPPQDAERPADNVISDAEKTSSIPVCEE